MEINIKIEGLNQLTDSLALLASAIAFKNGMEKTALEATQIPKEIKEEVKEKVKEVTPAKEKLKEAPVKEVIEEVATVEDVKEKEIPGITIEEVRAAFMAKNSKGNTPKLKEILKEFNVAKVTDLEEDHFEGVLARLEAI